MAKRHKLSQNSLSILWWQSTLMPAVLKTHRKASFIFCSPLLPMGGHCVDCCLLTGWIQIWFDTPTENITGLLNKQDQSERIREIYRVLDLYRNIWNIKDTLSDFVIAPTVASKPWDVLSAYCWCVQTQPWDVYTQLKWLLVETIVCDSKGSVSEFHVNVFHPPGAANTDLANKAVTCEHSHSKKKRVQLIT